MRLGRLSFAAAIVLALAWFALRSPLPVADPRFLQQDFAGAGAPLSISAYLEAGDPRGRGPGDALAYLLADRDDAIASHGRDRVVTVVGADAAAAAAGARALHEAGAGGWVELARRQGLAQVMVVEADGSISVTRPLNERLKLLQGRSARVVP